MKSDIIIYLSILFIHVTAFSDSVYDLLVENAHYCTLAYCSSQSTFEPGTPLDQACPLVDFCLNQTDTTLESIFNPNDTDDRISGFSYLSVDGVDKKVHSVFRGAHTEGDYLTLLDFAQCPYASVIKHGFKYDDFVEFKNDSTRLKNAILEKSGNDTVCDGCYVHCGTYLEFMKFIQEIFDSATPYLDQHYNLIVDGYSLGGIYALLTGVEFKTQGYNPLVLTYGSLKVGNPKFSKWVDEIFANEQAFEIVQAGGDLPYPSYSRVFQTADFAPSLPPSIPPLLEYQHAGLQFEITKILLPHPKSVVKFGGPSSSSSADVEAVNEETIRDDDVDDDSGYPHLHMFIEFSNTCSDE